MSVRGTTEDVSDLLIEGERARFFVLASLSWSAWQPDDWPLLAPRALVWSQLLLRAGVVLPFGAVFDLGYLLLGGDAFRFHRPVGLRLDGSEAKVRDAYESRFLLRRLGSAALPVLRHILRNSTAPDLAVARAIELLLGPVARELSPRVRWVTPPTLPASFTPADCFAARDRFIPDAGGVDVCADLVEQLVSLAGRPEHERRLEAEDYYELEHIRTFPRESLREVARRIKQVERILGTIPLDAATAWREQALASTSLESVGTYPTGGIAELTCSGPLENLVASELIYHEPGAVIDPFLVRFAEGSLLRYLRDGGVHRRLRRTVVFAVEDRLEYQVPVSAGRLLVGTKVIRCLLGLVLALMNDLLTVFARDDVAFGLHLLTACEATPEAVVEGAEIQEVLHLLFAEKEAIGQVSVTSRPDGLEALLAELPHAPERRLTLVLLGQSPTLRTPPALPAGADCLTITVGPEPPGPPAGSSLDLTRNPEVALAALRRAVLERLVT